MVTSPSPIDYSTSRAVLIGVSAYEDDRFPAVPAAMNSVQGMEAVLTDPTLGGWPADRVTVLADPADSRQVGNQLHDLAWETEGALLLYFVGHGTLTERGELCLALKDTRFDRPELFGLRYSDVRNFLISSPARSKVLVLDCCYSGRAIQTLSGSGHDLADTTEVTGTYTLTASDHVAHVVPLEEQVNACTSFTGALLDLVRTGVPGAGPLLTFERVFPVLRQRLADRGLPAPNQRGVDTSNYFVLSRNPASLADSEQRRAAKAVRPYPHQQDMLERLRVEREIRGRHRNLLVAATGTGKTIMAALDYEALRLQHGSNLKILFVAHRGEILKQSRQAYQKVLGDADFGELFVGGDIPEDWDHVFASVQSLHARALENLSPEHFDVIVIDEFHHGVAPTYRRIIDHFHPQELLGLTATPERMDGRNIQDEFFDGRIAAEMRLWEAMENDLLSPFHYFGIADDTDFEALTWRRGVGSYDANQVDKLLTGNYQRGKLVVEAVRSKIIDPDSMRALGFCVSVDHARFMADIFQFAGFRAKAVDGTTPSAEREHALAELRDGRVQVLFSVDLFNEGLDIPDVNTLLLLRPTSSATVFLQQLGRGLRRTPEKSVLTVLDFIGQHRKEFRFEEQFHLLTNLTRNRLTKSVEQDFPQLPSGCKITLDQQSKERILDNIKTQVSVNVAQLAREVKAYAELRLDTYLCESNREIKDLYRARNSWTHLLRRANLLTDPAPEGEAALLKRIAAFLHVDDQHRVTAYTQVLKDDAPSYDELTPLEQAYARMLFFSLWPLGGGFSSYTEGLNALRPHSAFRSELRQVLEYNFERTEHYPIPLEAAHNNVPLTVNSSYSREEILSALGQAAIDGSLPGHFQAGVTWCEILKTDALLITIEKSEKDFSAQTRYKDFAMGPNRFHWESQNQTAEDSTTGQRYQKHNQLGTHILLFARRYKKNDIGGPQPWTLLGPADYVSHEGSKPMGIVWDLHHNLPADMWTYSAKTDG